MLDGIIMPKADTPMAYRINKINKFLYIGGIIDPTHSVIILSLFFLLQLLVFHDNYLS